MKRPLRFWRTGAVAVVLAAIGGTGFADDASAVDEGFVQCLVSPYDVDETVQRLELSARQHGVSVFGCFDRRDADAARAGASAPDTRVVVLESEQGGTPVLMATDDASAVDGRGIELPLSIRVRSGGDGRAEVWVEASGHRDDLPPELERDLATLDGVVRDALRA